MSTRKVKLIAATVAALSAATVFGPGAAQARKVNTGTGTSVTTTATVTGGIIRVKGTSFDLGNLNPKVTLTGTVSEDGTWNIPTGGINFTPLTIPDVDPVGDVTVRIQPTAAWTGNINPLNGTGSLRMQFRIKAEGGSGLTGLGGSCYIQPVDVNAAITGTTSPPGPNGPISGTLYDPTPVSGGTMKLVNNSVGVPGASGCGAVIGIDGQVNDALGLPSAAGNNEAQFTLQFSPILTKGIEAKIGSNSFSGFAPHAVTLNAGTSTAKAGSTYRFDVDGNGTWDTAASTNPSTTFTYNAGTYAPKVLVNDGVDQSTATLSPSIVVTDRPDVTIKKTAVGDFRAGNTIGYKLEVKNEGAGATTGLTTVTDTLPAGLMYQGFTGSGWSCNAVGQAVTCTRAPGLAANTSAPDLTLNAKIALTSPSALSNTATVSTPNEPDLPDTDTASSTVTYVDLGITKSHTGNFRPNRNGKYKLLVENLGDHATVGTTTVTDVLPAGLGWVSDNPPAGWDCDIAGQTFTCSTTDAIDPAEQAEIELTVQPDNRAWTTPVTNTATVSTTDDVNSANNSSSDLTPVISQPDLILSKTHTGDFRVGTNGTYRLDVTNDGALNSSGTITVTDTLPDGLDYVSASGTGWTCDSVADVVTCERSDALAPDDDTEDILIEVAVTNDAAPTVVNSATVANASDVVPTNNAALDPTTVKRVDLSIEKRAVGGFRVGDTANYVLDVHNDGTANTFAPTTVTDTLPASLTYQGASGPGWTCSASGQDVTCTKSAAVLAGADAGDIELEVLVDGSAVPSVSNTATVATTNDVNSANNSSTATSPVTTVDLAIESTHNGAFRVGTTRTYKLGIENEGSFPSTGVTTVVDTLPAGLSYVSASGSGWNCSAVDQEVTCTRDALNVIAASATAPSIVLQVAVGVEAAPEATNEVSISTTGDRNELNDTDSDVTEIVFNDLGVEVHSNSPFRSGRTGAYTVDVKNHGAAATNDATRLTATLPTGLTYKSSNATGWDCSASAAQQVDCVYSGAIAALGVSGPGLAEPLGILVNVAKNAATPRGTTWTVSTAGDPTVANDSATDSADVTSLDLTIDNAHDGEFVAGGTGRYKIEVENLSDIATESATKVTETLPAGLTFTSASGDGWNCSRSGQDVTCRHADPIEAGDTASFDLETEIAATAGSPIQTTATVVNADDVNAANDSDSDSAPVTSKPDVSLDVAPVLETDGGYRVGTNGTWTMSVRNLGAAATTGATTVTSKLPDGLSFVRGTGNGWDCSASGADVTCTHTGALPANSRSDIKLETGIALAAMPAVALGGQVSATNDADAQNNKGEGRASVRNIDATVKMSHLLNLPFATGVPSSFSIAVGNNGSAATEGATTVRSRLPDGVIIDSVKGDGWSCSFQLQDVTCVRSGSIPGNDNVPDIDLRVKPTARNVPGFTGSVSVETPNDTNAANDTATDPVVVNPFTLGGGPSGEGELTGLTVTAGSLKVTKAGTISLKVACAGVGTCKGTLALKGKKKVKGKIPALGSAKFSVDGGKSKTIKVKLSRAGLKLVNASKKYAATATATLSPAVNGIKPATRNISITPFKAPKKK